MSDQNHNGREPGGTAGERRASRCRHPRKRTLSGFSVAALLSAFIVAVGAWAILPGVVTHAHAQETAAAKAEPAAATATPAVRSKLSPWQFATSPEHAGTEKTLTGTGCSDCHGIAEEGRSSIAGWAGPPPVNHREGGGCGSCHRVLQQRIDGLGTGLETHPPRKRTEGNESLVGIRPDHDSSGVTACADCHTLDTFLPELAEQIRAAHVAAPGAGSALAGSPERLQAHQDLLARSVREQIGSHGSEQCYLCHTYEYMDPRAQDRQARRRHSEEYREATNRSCLDCHNSVH